MVNAAIVGLGWWGKVLVQSIQGKSDKIRFTHGQTRTREKAEAFAKEQGFALVDRYEDLLSDPEVDAVVLATPHSKHREQIEAAAAAGKHVFCEKPITLTVADARAAIASCEKAGVVCAVGFNRRFHPAIAELRARVGGSELGTLLHTEGTMNAPAGLTLPATAWRADKRETPVGGLTPMGVHMIDSFIELFGPIEEVYCQSLRRAVPNDTDDTSSILFRFANGMTGYLGTSLAGRPTYRFATYGTKGTATISRMDLAAMEIVLAGESGNPADDKVETKDFSGFNMNGAEMEAFGQACAGEVPYPVPADHVVHGIEVLEAIVRSAEGHRPEKVGS